MHILDLIYKKRDGQRLTKEEIQFFVDGVCKQKIPDYQIVALLMAIYFRGLNQEETATLTLAMAHSGEVMDLSSIEGIKVDKHSTGGVGDKCTLIVAPIVASLGLPVAKMSGRGLGFTGGTVDKLESIEGFSCSIEMETFIQQVNAIKMVVAGQTSNLAPADKRLYALRDVSGTIESPALIAASIMSKKIAGGADKIVLDITCGRGAFMKTLKEAKELAQIMVDIGKLVNKEVRCVISNMIEPLGTTIGNALEVQEACEVLQNRGPKDTQKVALCLAGEMLAIAGVEGGDSEQCLLLAKKQLENGKAYQTFLNFIQAQGGKVKQGKIQYSNKNLPVQKYSLISEHEGYLAELHADVLGLASQALGGGRLEKTDEIHPLVGLCLHKKISSYVQKGEILADFYYSDEKRLQKALELYQSALVFSREKILPSEEILAILR